MTIFYIKNAIIHIIIWIIFFIVGLFIGVTPDVESSKAEPIDVEVDTFNQPPVKSETGVPIEEVERHIPVTPSLPVKSIKPVVTPAKSIEKTKPAEPIQSVKSGGKEAPVIPVRPVIEKVESTKVTKPLDTPKLVKAVEVIKEANEVEEPVTTKPKPPVVPVTSLLPSPENGVVFVSLPSMKKGYMTYVVIEKGKQNYNFKMERAQNVPLPFGSGLYTVIIYQGNGDDFIEVERQTVDATFSSTTFALQQTVLSPGVEDIHVKQIMDTEFEDWRNWSIEKRIEMVHVYITNTFQYDYDVATNPEAWYLPSAQRLVTTKKGICYDMASLTSSLLREMQVPTHVVMGYAKNIDIYHAWNEVYIDKSWKIVDTTFDLGGMSKSPYKDSSDYTQVHYRF